MTNRTSKLVLAAVLLSSIPLAASADDRGCDHDGAPPAAWPPAVAYPYQQPAGTYPYQQPDATYPAYPDTPRPREWREWRDGREWWGRRGWRARELAEVRAQLRELDFQRDRFYAENRWRPGRVRHFERWYAVRRAELERRWYELQPVAWR